MSSREFAALERALIAQELASIVRHDLRNKLGNVRNAAYYIRRRVEQSGAITDPRVATFFKLIDDELTAASNLVAAGLGQKELASQTAEPISLDSCIRHALELAPPPDGVTVRSELAAPTPLPIQRAEVVLLLRHLIENAVEAMPDGGTLTLHTAEDRAHATVAISDTGPGLSDEAKRRALDPFFTEKPGHSGLGLSLARRIAAHHGAQLRIIDTGDSANPSPGACLSVTFPLASPAA